MQKLPALKLTSAANIAINDRDLSEPNTIAVPIKAVNRVI